MRRLRRVAAMAGSAGLMLGALALGGPASAAPASPHLATAVPHAGIGTTTTLLISTHAVDFDQQAWGATFQVKDANGDVVHSSGVGDLRTSLPDGTTTDLCSNVPISANGIGRCTILNGDLPAHGYKIIAHYEGVLGSFEQSDSDPQDLTVNPEPTSMTLKAVSPVFYGEESAETFTSTVSPRTSGTPTGQVRGLFANQACVAILANGTASCSLPATDDTLLAPDTYGVLGTYDGNGNFAKSDTGFDTFFVVSPGRTVTTLSLSPPRIGFGQQQNERLTAQVTPRKAGTPTGTVKIMAGQATICPDQPLGDGTVTCDLTPRQLHVGSHQLTAVYSGDTNFGAATSVPVTLTVTSGTTTSLTLSARRVKFGREQSERLTVKVRPAVTGSGTPRGKITIKAGSATVCVITLRRAAGNCKLSPRKLRRGTYHLTARYPGTSPFTASTSVRKTLTITR